MVVPSRSAWIRPASFSTLKCPDMVGLETSKWLAISPAGIAPALSSLQDLAAHRVRQGLI